MDIIKRILCFSLLGDLLFFDKKSETLEEVSLMKKIYKINGWVIFILLCVLAIFYGSMLIPVINLGILIIFIMLIYVFFLIGLIYILGRNITLFIGYQKLDLTKFEKNEVKYLNLLKINILLVLVLYILIPVAILFWLFTLVIPVYLLALFIQVIIILLFIAVGITKIVFYVISRFRLYSIIKSEQF